MTTRRKIIKVPRGEARLYLAKAKQFSEEAAAAITGSRNDAAMLNAVHAAISAADAVSVALGGRRSADSDHQRATDLLQEVGAKSAGMSDALRQLRMVLAKKNAVEYESRRASAKEAADVVERAARLVSWASQVVEAARL